MIRAMRALCSVCVCVLMLLYFGRAHAEDKLVELIAPGSEFVYRVDATPLPTSHYGALALFDAEGPTRALPTRPVLWPKLVAAPVGWPTSPLTGAQRGRAPLASRHGSAACKCKTEVGDSKSDRQAALYASHTFEVGTSLDLAQYSLLELRILYRDGVRVFLNGAEIARRAFPTASDLRPAAKASKGPEWEEFLVSLAPGMLVAGRNVLNVEVRPGAHSHGVRLDLAASLRRPGRVVRGPMVQRVREHSATIRFDTDLPSRSSVEYGASEAFGQEALSAGGAYARHHSVTLEGLRPGEAVHYRVVAAGRAGPTHRFHVPPEAPEPLRFAVYGDVRGGHRVHGAIAQSLLEEAIDFVVVTGDMVLRGSDEADWQRFFTVAAPLLARLPYYPVAGNHDTGASGDERRYMSELFSLWPAPEGRPARGAWHSFDISGVHFVMLDSNHYRHDAQLEWLAGDLSAASARGARAIFAVAHAGPYSRGLHMGHSYAQEHYAPLLAKYGTTLLFSGHDHLYQRGTAGGLNYMVSGGGGAPLYAIRCGVRGKPRCKVKDGMKHVAKEHHYIVVTVFPTYVSACPKRVDRTPLEACIRYPLQ